MNENRKIRRDEEVDVIIVGAGPSGSVAAMHLAQAGFSVVAFEQGHWPDANSYPGRREEWELMAQKPLNANPNVRDRIQDYPVDNDNSDINALMFAGVGGSATLYAGQWVPFLPSDFRTRTLDDVGDDWPFNFEDLQPYQMQTDREVGVSGLAGDPAYPPRTAFPTPALPIGPAAKRAADGMNRLGWHWWPGSNSLPSKPTAGLNACVRRGTCMAGCPEGAKSTTDLTHWPKAIKAGARLVTGARVSAVLTNKDGLATGVSYFDESGTERRQKGAVVILCANGIGTPRLLMMSGRNGRTLANSSGLVGKRLMMHPFAAVTGVFDEDGLKTWRGPFGQNLYSLEFYETDDRRGFKRGAKWNFMPTGGPLGLSGTVSSKFIQKGAPDLDAVWGRKFHDTALRRVGRTVQWGIIGEDLPEESNFVSLSDSLTDTDGLPAPSLHYKTSENSTKMLKFMVARATEAMQAAGGEDLGAIEQVRDSGWHILGTTKMGNDPATSVVDHRGRCHDIPNLYVMDGSTFPTSGAMNPTATIMAVALRSTAHLIAGRQTQKVA